MHLNAHQSANDTRAARGVIYLWFALKEILVTHKVQSDQVTSCFWHEDEKTSW
jgi:hypothetical protein